MDQNGYIHKEGAVLDIVQVVLDVLVDPAMDVAFYVHASTFVQRGLPCDERPSQLYSSAS